MDGVADVGAFFADYLIREYKKKAGDTADFLLANWQGIDQKNAARLVGPSGVNVLIEFRKSESSWSREFSRPFRLEWCQRLTHVHSIRELADSCHFVAWDVGDAAQVDALLAVYSRVCSPQLAVEDRGPRVVSSETHPMFARAYLQRRRGTSNHGLLEYLGFVTSLVNDATLAAGKFDIEMLWLHVREGKLLGCWINDFFSLFALAEWLNEKLANPGRLSPGPE